MTAKSRLLIVDDDRSMRSSLLELAAAAGWEADAVPRAEQVAAQVASFAPDVILSDVRMPGLSGVDLVERRLAGDVPVVLISAHGDIPTAVQAMQAGAYSFVEKPYDPRRLLTILAHAAENHRLKRSTGRLQERLTRLSGLDRILLGDTPVMAALRAHVTDLADSRAPVLLQGETGTGKELVARALHDLGPDPDGPFVAINCANISADRFDEVMFGDGQTRGYLPAADGGTLFLDEVLTLVAETQARLLRVLETHEVPGPDGRPRKLRLRIIAASNDQLETAIAEGRFRADLSYRLNTFTVDLPPLRDRREDVLLLFAAFVADLATLYEVDAPEPSAEDVAALLAHDWPGNVRELRQVAERRVLAARRGQGSVAEALRVDTASDLPGTLREAVAAFERELIAKAIRSHQGRMDAVAEALGIGRRTLNEKIVKLGLDKDAIL
ncbi:MAG: sigma-54 dependent transcriptional regulator [Pseudomonadota bacterium]